MADFENSADVNASITNDLNENFNTIKTLLNSIRAQGILNTSDVDKLLTGINTKLDKINTDEDIDLIKAFLNELKKNLDERHDVLVSKFGAIESLFSNLLKNSNELPKSAEIKELFDIVATNLSVFSREVLSQKDALTDIALKIDTMRSDDTDKKDIIKNITLLKPDLERVSNGFDSIVISLNDNFKTVIKTITSSDKSEYFDKFSDTLNNIEMSSNTLLSAIQILDKKSDQAEDILKAVLTKDDLTQTNQRLNELTAQSGELNNSINTLSDKYSRIDNLADKIDASVNIIASLKSVLEEADNQNTQRVIDDLKGLEDEVKKITSDTSFEDFKKSLEGVLGNLMQSSSELDINLKASFEEIKNVISIIKSLDINLNFDALTAALTGAKSEIISHINEVSDKMTTLNEANISRVLNDLSTSADSLNNRLNQSQSDIVVLCEKNFNSVYENIADLKSVVSQIDENAVSANNAIFSSITDRLTEFETALRSTLETQERTVTESSGKLVEKIEDIKNISGMLDYKLDSTVVEAGNVRREFENLKSSVDSVLALDFVNTVKDLRADLYASKQEMVNTFENSSSDLSEKFSNDLFSKYELLISKLDSVEDELKKVQVSALSEIKPILDKISSSIVDVISYVSETKNGGSEAIDSKIDEIAGIVKETNLNYIDNVRDIVDVIRAQVETNLRNISEDNERQIEKIREKASENVETLTGVINDKANEINASVSSLSQGHTDLKNDIKYSYSKLLEIQDLYSELKDLMGISDTNSNKKFEDIIQSADSLKANLDGGLSELKSELINKISEFKTELQSERDVKFNEIGEKVCENSHKTTDDIKNLIEDLRKQFGDLHDEAQGTRTSALAKILENFVALKEYAATLNNGYNDALTQKVNELTEHLNSVRAILNKVDENVDADMTRQLSIIESNFETLISQITILFEKADNDFTERVNSEFSNISEKMLTSVSEKLDAYKETIENAFEGLQKKAECQTDYLQDRITNLNSVLKEIWENQAADNLKQMDEISEKLKDVLKENLKMSELDYLELKGKINEFSEDIANDNQKLTNDFKSQVDEITKYIDSVLGVQADDMNVKQGEITDLFRTGMEDLLNRTNDGINALNELEASMESKFGAIKALNTELSTNEMSNLEASVGDLKEQIELHVQALNAGLNTVSEALKGELKAITNDIEKETDTVIAELIEQFELLKRSQADESVNFASKLEDIISAQIYNNIEDLKSYLDVKTDDSVLSSKLDSLKTDINSSVGNLISNITKMLDVNVFNTAISDFRMANEMLINSTADSLNDKFKEFLNDNSKAVADSLKGETKQIEDKLFIFDKKFTDTVTDKFEEIKILSNTYNSSLEYVQNNISKILSEFDGVKSNIGDKIDEINENLQSLNKSFDGLRSQISNKSFDEAFQMSVNKQISGLENLINEQFSYIEDINDLCASSLPDVTELNTLVKGSLINTVNEFAEKFKSQDLEETIETGLKQLKTDIITQILNVFNQISFETEQEEILDYIQDKHDALIDILSKIVPAADKINIIKSDIGHINDKINSIISSEGDIDYVYSLQDLESDIANLRLALNEIKDSSKDEELSQLAASTDNIYKLVESIKNELPKKSDFEGIAEDIVSISSRTNKLILSSEESYKMLQDNIQDFKLVVNDFDERTRNFARESGMDKVNKKLNALNDMVEKGEKTNQVFNQVFEYLAEWIDSASSQIDTIAGKIDSLDDIGQIKDMIIGMKSDSEDNSDNIEMVEALGAVFDKQNKKISSIETKLDKLIVTNTVSKKKTPDDMVDKLLAAMDKKFTAQQSKINSLEKELKNIMGMLGENSSEQLSKKVGSMDRQIAKMNKSIEKIASHVVEK